MRKNILGVIQSFIQGRSKKESTCSTDGEYLYSYQMKIARRDNDTYMVIDLRASDSNITTGQIRAVNQYLNEHGIKFLIVREISTNSEQQPPQVMQAPKRTTLLSVKDPFQQ